MKSVAIVLHPEKKRVISTVKETIDWFKERNFEVKLSLDDAQKVGFPQLGYGEKDLIKVDFILVLGGDGSILKTAQMLKGESVPVLGVNFGKIGFLSEIERAELFPSLERVLKKEYFLETRLLLEARIYSGRKSLSSYFALNEVVLGYGGRERPVEFDVYISGDLFVTYVADGIIFSTPTGSTAYSLSAGGPVLFPSVKGMVVTPVCPHSFLNRSLVLGDKDTVEIKLPHRHSGSTSLKKTKLSINVDGQSVFSGEFDRLEVKCSKKVFNLIRLDEISFCHLLRTKLRGWGF